MTPATRFTVGVFDTRQLAQHIEIRETAVFHCFSNLL